MVSDAGLDVSRIDYLLGAGALNRSKMVLAGLGSGGFVVLERLAMCGVRNWALYDPDALEAVNLVKHPARRADLGRRKTEIASEWLLDRNPGCVVGAVGGDVMSDSGFIDQVSGATMVICAVDDPAARSFINAVCVEHGVPCVFGSVFRTGLGGEVYAYLPGETGCHDCKMLYSLKAGLDIENWLEITPEEQGRVYGMGEQHFSASALAADISIVASYHAHYIISLLAAPHSNYLTAPSFNWLTVALRRVEGLFGAMYETSRVLLRPQQDCHLNCGVAQATER